ncbi:hypothetical protein DFH08DRAFT_962178 [Mycena albidolilacea]|uniref:Uncharacterized protein n=1 Tax=Mycena albidolilacea TaxID=1033008 RepID=A0AAD6ZYD5_9AGAR|nr:hypothetical protein DFH08DRAFT_962178 [Mycena albidolilacea]
MFQVSARKPTERRVHSYVPKEHRPRLPATYKLPIAFRGPNLICPTGHCSVSLQALKEFTDAFPPPKSVVGAVLAVWDISQRAKRCKSDARDITDRTAEILLEVAASAVPDESAIPSQMLQSIERFTSLDKV